MMPQTQIDMKAKNVVLCRSPAHCGLPFQDGDSKVRLQVQFKAHCGGGVGRGEERCNRTVQRDEQGAGQRN